MPNCSRLGPSGVLREIEACLEVGIRSFVFFPATPDHLKSPRGEESHNPDGLVQQTLQRVKQRFPKPP